jgi:hypothetical protein
MWDWMKEATFWDWFWHIVAAALTVLASVPQLSWPLIEKYILRKKKPDATPTPDGSEKI